MRSDPVSRLRISPFSLINVTSISVSQSLTRLRLHSYKPRRQQILESPKQIPDLPILCARFASLEEKKLYPAPTWTIGHSNWQNAILLRITSPSKPRSSKRQLDPLPTIKKGSFCAWQYFKSTCSSSTFCTSRKNAPDRRCQMWTTGLKVYRLQTGARKLTWGYELALNRESNMR